MQPPRKQLRALNGQLYDERECRNGDACYSRLVDGYPGHILAECLSPEDWQYLHNEGMFRVEVQPCVLCRRSQVSAQVAEFKQYPTDEALMFLQDYRNACTPNDSECYREDVCFTPKHFACLGGPVVRFQLGDYYWKYDQCHWRVDQSRLLQANQASHQERNECVSPVCELHHC